jgi:hypothetical protein
MDFALTKKDVLPNLPLSCFVTIEEVTPPNGGLLVD